MKPDRPESLDDILSLRPQLREDLRFGAAPGGGYLERPEDDKRYNLSDWQQLLLMEMDGERAFGPIIEDLELQLMMELPEAALLGFYSMITSERLVTVDAPLDESIFELLPEVEVELETDSEQGAESDQPTPEKAEVKEAGKGFGKFLRMAGVVVIAIGIIRVAWLVAPILEPMIDRAYQEVAEIFSSDDARDSDLNSTSVTAERSVLDSDVSGVAFAGRGPIDSLRQELAECRIRRDEYYLQNNEEGYREEVERMTSLAKRIGKLELSGQ